MCCSRRKSGEINFQVVIPAKAGIQFDLVSVASIPKQKWIPAFAGMTAIEGRISIVASG